MLRRLETEEIRICFGYLMPKDFWIEVNKLNLEYMRIKRIGKLENVPDEAIAKKINMVIEKYPPFAEFCKECGLFK